MNRCHKTILFVVFVLMGANFSFAMYDPQTGRFMQRDPLGINPAGGLRNSFGPKKQYADGMSVYEYAKSDSINSKDAFGLLATPWPPAPPATSKYDDKACCKIETTHIARYSGSGYYPVVSGYTTCNQVTINSKGASHKYACKCHYKNQKNVKVYGSYAGKCCWCKVYIGWVTDTSRADTDQRYHTKLYVKCEDRPSASFTAETTPNNADDPSIPNLIIGGEPVYPIVDKGNKMYLEGYSWTYQGRISCDAAELSSGVIANTKTYWSIRHNCWIWAHQVSNTLMGLCP